MWAHYFLFDGNLNSNYKWLPVCLQLNVLTENIILKLNLQNIFTTWKSIDQEIMSIMLIMSILTFNLSLIYHFREWCCGEKKYLYVDKEKLLIALFIDIINSL